MQRYIISVFVLFIFALTSQAADLRSWTGSNGKVIEAEFVSFDGKIVKLKNASGKELNVLLSLFSKEDQEFVKNGGKTNTDDPFGEESTSISKRSEFKPLKIDKQAAYLAIIKELEKALKEAKHPRTIFTIYCHLASVQAMAGQTEAAKKNLEKAKELSRKILKDDDDDNLAIFVVSQLAIVETYLGNFNENLLRVNGQIFAATWGVYGDIADIMFKQGIIGEAKKILTVTIKEGKSVSIENTWWQPVYWRVISTGSKYGFFDDALILSSKIQNSQQRIFAFCEIGKHQLLAEKIEEAKKTFSIARSVADDSYTHARIGAAWGDAGYIQEALELVKQCTDPNYQSSILQSVAKRQFIEGKIDDAKKNLEKALSILGKNYDNVYSRMSIAAIYVTIGDEKTVEQICKSTCEQVEQNPDLHKRTIDLITIARAEFLMLNIDTAKSLLDRCIKNATSETIEDNYKKWQILNSIAYTHNSFDDKEAALTTYDLAEREAHKIQDTQQRERVITNTTAMRKNVGSLGEGWWGLSIEFNLENTIRTQVKNGRLNDSIKFVQKIKHPHLRARVLKIIAEELYGQKD